MVCDPDGYIFFRENEGGILAGGFEPVAKPIKDEDEKKSKNFQFVTTLLYDDFK